MSITDELRTGGIYRPASNRRYFIEEELTAIADRIDAEHERLMRERRGCIHYDQERHYCNVHDLTTEDYKRGYDDGFASADDWLAQHEDAMAEHGWVRRNKEHVISHATVEVTPHIDWSRMADELDEFAKIVRGMASGAE